MSKKHEKIISTNFEVGLFTICPSSRDDYDQNLQIKPASLKKQEFVDLLTKEISEKKPASGFPTDRPVFVLVNQFLLSEKELNSRDIDRMSTTILDVLKGLLLKDDSQVYTLLANKEVDTKITQNFIYISVSTITSKGMHPVLKKAGLERAHTLFYASLQKAKRSLN